MEDTEEEKSAKAHKICWQRSRCKEEGEWDESVLLGKQAKERMRRTGGLTDARGSARLQRVDDIAQSAEIGGSKDFVVVDKAVGRGWPADHGVQVADNLERFHHLRRGEDRLKRRSSATDPQP